VAYSSFGFSDCGRDSLSDYTAPLLCAKRKFLLKMSAVKKSLNEKQQYLRKLRVRAGAGG
jgi:hypothetical protein